MKTLFYVRSFNAPARRDVKGSRGFSLVITISLMVLLSLLAVGMLSMATISVRSSKNGDAMQQARANARMAMILAIGQLQKAAGPDQRITAPADLVDPSSTRALTGVWESRKIDPSAPAVSAAPRAGSPTTAEADGEFVGWLASDALGSGGGGAPPSLRPGAGRARLLDFQDDTKDVSAAIQKVENTGGMAWVTMEEGIKARYDLPLDEGATDEEKRARLRNPERTASDRLAGVRDFVPDEATAAKLVSFEQGALVAADRKAYGEGLLDMTPWSEGLLTDVVRGGLKQDLSLAFEAAAMPKELDGARLYSDDPNAALLPSDPYLNQLREFYRLYQTVNPNTPLASTTPSRYSPTQVDRRTRLTIPNPGAVDGAVIAPVVTRVNVAFSLVSREAHDHWYSTIPGRTGDSRRNYMVYLIYTPVVTLYNPYTVPVIVENMKITFQYLPLGFQFYRNGQPQTMNPALLSQFHISSESRTDWEDKFTATLTNSYGSGSSSQVTLAPGEARIFGVNHPPGTRWGSMVNYLWQNDLHASKTLSMNTSAGWNYNSGFIVDWLAPAAAGRAPDNSGLGVLGVRGNDIIDVAFTPLIPTVQGRPADSFSVEINARVNRRDRALGVFRYRYGTRDRLIKALEGGIHPSIGKITYPVRREKPWGVNELYQPNVENVPIENWTGPKQFAMFTLAARTSQDSLYPTRPGRDYSFANQVLDMDITTSHPAQMPMELSFLPVTGQGANTVGSLEVFSANDPRAFFFSGWSARTGLLHYPSFQIPKQPLVNLADFRHAHLAGSGYTTNPSYTVGESFAHPLVASDRVLGAQPGTADHAWLANRVMWDRYWLSGLRPGNELTGFLDGEPLPYNPRLRPWLGSHGKSEVASELAGSDGWKIAAAHSLMKGVFNVHSTSVEAWRAVLSSLRGGDVPIAVPPAGGGRPPLSMIAREEATDGTPLPRLLDGPADAMEVPAQANNQKRWAGFRELTDSEIDELANRIVENIRERGPFLSMGEFVNRRAGSQTYGESLRGALQEAIEEAGLNNKSAVVGARKVTPENAVEFQYANPKAAEGDTESTAAAYLTQGDLLSAIGSALAVRSDTFVIRAYGEARDGAGRLLAKATCEAVIQRLPDYIDPQDAADAPLAANQAGPELKSRVNQIFGRRMEIVSFRWLGDEVL